MTIAQLSQRGPSYAQWTTLMEKMNALLTLYWTLAYKPMWR